MIGAKTNEAKCLQYELEVEINASAEQVWDALINDTDAWWLPDFHMVAPDSTVEFDLNPGGRGLVEYKSDGGFLSWYQVQYYLPEQHTIYLVGSLAADFGGPSTSNMKLAIVEFDNGCKLQLTDSLFGNINEATTESLNSGWLDLFGNGLKNHVEATA